jgi:hypothetical protein
MKIVLIILMLSFCLICKKENKESVVTDYKTEHNQPEEKENKKVKSYVDYKIGDTLIVLANGGLKLREKPFQTSNTLLIVPDNTEVVVIEIDPNHVKINNIWGSWVKTKYMGKEGWLFDGFLIEKRKISNSIENKLNCKSIDFSNESEFHFLKVNTPLGLGLKELDFSQVLFCPNGKIRVLQGIVGTLAILDGNWFFENNSIKFEVDYSEDVPENILCPSYDDKCNDEIMPIKEEKYGKPYFSYKIIGEIKKADNYYLLTMNSEEIDPNPVKGKIRFKYNISNLKIGCFVEADQESDIIGESCSKY